MPDYPGAPGRTGYAVGLDVPASVLALLADLGAAGYAVRDAAANAARAARCARRGLGRRGAVARRLCAACSRDLPADAVDATSTRRGASLPTIPIVRDGAFRFRARAFGNVMVALPPDRGRSSDRRADYHDPALPPRHALVAFGLWLQHVAKVDALVHMGAHGTLEWLPGKAVALTASCFPEAVVGPLPVIYPFIVSNPGEAAQAKRRIAAVTIGHLPPPLVADRPVRRGARARAAGRRICAGRRARPPAARAPGAAASSRPRSAPASRAKPASTPTAVPTRRCAASMPGSAISRISPSRTACMSTAARPRRTTSIRRGRRAPQPNAPPCSPRSTAAACAPGPAGAPARGRRDVLPTGRNLFTADPRTLPTPTAMDLGRLAADEVMRAHLQAHGEMPRALVIDLWGSATLRTGGEEIAQGLALMGCRPTWDHATGRVTGIEVLPAADHRPPARRRHLAHLRTVPRSLPGADRAARRRGARGRRARGDRRGESAGGGAARRAATARRRSRASSAPRPAPTAPASRICSGARRDRATLGAAYLAAASHAYGGADGDGTAAPGAFAERVAGADLLVHPGDDPGRDLLEGAEDAAFVGGFAAAAATLGRAPDLIMLDAHRSAAAARAAARRGAGAHRARPRDQSALHRRPDAPRPARRRRAGRDRRPAGRLRGDDRRGAERAASISCTTPISPTRACATSCCARTRRPRARSPSGSTPRAGTAFGIRAATTSAAISWRSPAEASP